MEDKEALLAARGYLYALFHNLFGNEPSEGQLAAVDRVLAREALDITGIHDPAAEGLLGALDALATGSGGTGPLKAEYTVLFIGPGKLPAPPWESVYTTGEQVIFQRSTLEIRNFYRWQGLIPELYPKVADDHIALELDFLRLLGQRALEAQQAGDDAACKEALAASVEFLDEHLLKWVGFFAEALNASGKGSFYPLAAQALATFAARDAELLKGLVTV
jgi:TorA maturation chaperone TorD